MRLPKAAPSSNKNEFAVIGLGRFGSSLARTLVSRGASVLGIDRSPEPVQDLADELTQTVVLDATNEAALREVDITSFGTVIVAIGSNFEANLLTTVALRELGVANIICKATNLRQRDILLKVGAHRVVLPNAKPATAWRLNSLSRACSRRLTSAQAMQLGRSKHPFTSQISPQPF